MFDVPSSDIARGGKRRGAAGAAGEKAPQL